MSSGRWQPRLYHNRQGLLVVSVSVAAALVLLSLLSLSLPGLKRNVLDSTAALPVGWHKDVDSDGKTYYWNRRLGTSSWDPPTATQQLSAPKQPSHLLKQASQQPAAQPLAESSDTSSSAPRWDEMAVPLGQFGSVEGSSAPRSEQPVRAHHMLQALSPESGVESAGEGPGGEDAGEEEEEEKTYGELTPTAGWPRDLPGATGDDTSWIVGMHREPLWSDSMTHACGLAEPCPVGRADRGHGMQMDSNPYVDKRRTFDPYANGDLYDSDSKRREASRGRNDYPWDPTEDAQFYGEDGADCSDGVLRDECYERPELDDLQNKQAVWKKKFDEFAAPGAGEEQADKAAAAKQADGFKGALLRMPAQKDEGFAGALKRIPEEVDPWARSVKTGMLHGIMHASSSIKATAREAAADAERKQQDKHFVGGEPVVASLGKVVDRIEAAYKSGVGFFSPGNLSELERKFLRARRARAQQKLSRHHALRTFDSTALAQGRKQSRTTLLAAVPALVSSPTLAVPRWLRGTSSEDKHRADAKHAAAHAGSIWESPEQVAEHGVFGSAAALPMQRKRASAQRRAKMAKVLAAVEKGDTDGGGHDPLPMVRDEALKVAEEAANSAESLISKVTGQVHPASWEEANIQKGVLRKESTKSNLMKLLKERDDKLLQQVSGLSPAALKQAMLAAEKDSKGNKAVAAPKQALAPWEEKVEQQGTLRHETVKQNLRAALHAREKILWKEKTGWKSIKDMEQAEAFAENLAREVKNRRKEEASHPLVPSVVKSVLEKQGAGLGSSAARKGSAADDVEEMQARAKEARERRELDRVREGEPLVKALQSEVENDEQELTAEAQQQSMTLKQLHADQKKLNKQLAYEESITPSAPQARGGEGAAKAQKRLGHENQVAGSGEKDGLGQKLSSTSGAPVSDAHVETPEKYGISGRRAEEDLEEYFAKQQVASGTLHRPRHSTKAERRKKEGFSVAHKQQS